MKKKILTSIMILSFAFALSLMLIPETSQAKSDPWYKSVISQRSEKAGYKYYALVDINKDGSKELILATRKDGKIFDGCKAEVWTRYNKKNKKIKSINNGAGDELRYYKKGKALVYYYRGSGEAHVTVYKLAKGALKSKKQLDYYGPNHDPKKDGKNKTASYYIGKKSYSKKSYEKEFNKYFSKKTVISFKPVK